MAGGQNGDEVIKSVGKRRVRIAGRFFPQGAGAIVNTSNQGKAGWTVARADVGKFILTVDREWLKLIPVAAPAVQLAVPVGCKAVWGPIDKAAKTAEIHVFDDAAAPLEIAADANNSIGFELEAIQDGVQG